MEPMDWLTEFVVNFSNDPVLTDISAKKMHGSIQINFCDGHPINYNITMHRKGTMIFTTDGVYMVATPVVAQNSIKNT